MFYVYVLQCADGTFYVGFTTNIEKRVSAHNHLKSAAHYTKIRRPVKLLYSEQFKTKSEALRREHAIKKMTREKKIALTTITEL